MPPPPKSQKRSANTTPKIYHLYAHVLHQNASSSLGKGGKGGEASSSSSSKDGDFAETTHASNFNSECSSRPPPKTLPTSASAYNDLLLLEPNFWYLEKCARDFSSSSSSSPSGSRRDEKEEDEDEEYSYDEEDEEDASKAAFKKLFGMMRESASSSSSFSLSLPPKLKTPSFVGSNTHESSTLRQPLLSAPFVASAKASSDRSRSLNGVVSVVVVREESSERDDDDDTEDFPKAFLLVVFVVVLCLLPREETKTTGCAAAAEDDMLGCRSVL